MSTYISAVSENLEWKQAYMAAILEKDRTRVVSLIEDARSKLAARLDDLTAELHSYDEIEAIQDADYLLQALESSLSYRIDLHNSRPRLECDSPRKRKRGSLPAILNTLQAIRPVLVPVPRLDPVLVLPQESPASSKLRSTAIADRRGSDRGAWD
jgi:hypothetical protein